MRGVTVLATSLHFLLRTLSAPSPPPFPLLPSLTRRRLLQTGPPIQDRTFLLIAASGPPMESTLKNGSGDVKRNEEKVQSPVPPEAGESLSAAWDLPPEAPEKPEPGDCCGSGCVPCVWDLYYEELDAYTKNLEAYNKRVSSKQK